VSTKSSRLNILRFAQCCPSVWAHNAFATLLSFDLSLPIIATLPPLSTYLPVRHAFRQPGPVLPFLDPVCFSRIHNAPPTSPQTLKETFKSPLTPWSHLHFDTLRREYRSEHKAFSGGHCAYEDAFPPNDPFLQSRNELKCIPLISAVRSSALQHPPTPAQTTFRTIVARANRSRHTSHDTHSRCCVIRGRSQGLKLILSTESTSIRLDISWSCSWR